MIVRHMCSTQWVASACKHAQGWVSTPTSPNARALLQGQKGGADARLNAKAQEVAPMSEQAEDVAAGGRKEGQGSAGAMQRRRRLLLIVGAAPQLHARLLFFRDQDRLS